MPIKHPQEKGGKKPTNWLQYPPLITVDGAFKAEKYLTKEKKKYIYIYMESTSGEYCVWHRQEMIRLTPEGGTHTRAHTRTQATDTRALSHPSLDSF